MTDYTHLNAIQTIFMTLIASFSCFTAIPIVIKCLKRQSTTFESYMVGMSILTSFMYHICEIYNATIFLDELQWHRLDNVFAITTFCLAILHFFGAIFENSSAIKWFALLFIIIVQEKDPWNVFYTALPCILFAVVAIFLRLYYRKTYKVQYKKKDLTIGLTFLLIGLIFFYLGLDDTNDYLRAYHGLWHVCASVFGYYCIGVSKISRKQIPKTQIEFDD